MKQKQYTNEFKYEAVKLATTGEKSAAEIARHLGISENNLYRWIRKYGPSNDGTVKATQNVHEELIQLRKENRILKEERDILKKVATKIHKMIYHMWRNGTTYNELGADFFDKLNREHLKKRLISRLESLDLDVQVTPRTVPANT
jgi:transposase